MTRARVLPVLMLISLAACDKVPLTSPTGSTITLSVDKTSVPIGGTAQLVAVVTEASGTAPQNGTMVTFNSGFGTITPQDAPTVGGIARATFTGTTSGTAKVGAFSGAAKATEVEVKVGGAAAERITVRAEPSTLPATGGTATIIANVQDATGTALPNTPVNFSTDSGTLSSNSVPTDASGEARVQLTTTKTAKVTAAAGAKTGDVTITAVPAPGVSITLCAGAGTGLAGNAPVVGVPVTCTVTPTVTTGGGLVTNVTINWGDGTGDQSLGPITGATSVSHVYTRSDIFNVIATATDANGQVGRGSVTLNVNRSLPTLTTFSCPTGTQSVGVAGAFTLTPAANPPIQISNITVDFGDGTSRNLGAPTGQTSFTKAYGSEGGYTATATVTDVLGQRGTSSCSVIVSRAASPTITFSQTSDTSTPATPAIPESFEVSAATATSLSLRSLVVTRKSNGETLYNQAGGGSFTAAVAVNDILVATATDSVGNVSTRELIVK